jgi:phage FluMu protein Com
LEAGVTEPGPKRRCPTCGHLLSQDAFYVNCGECKDCKRLRSQRNRALQARKVAAFERFVDVLINLADRTAEPPAEQRTSPASEAVA